ncbi:MAG: VOC family protein [Chloroflexota bacterium]
MQKIKAEASPFHKFHHVTIVVKSMHKAVEFYSLLGIGPFKPYPYKSTFQKTLIKIAQIGALELQLVQPGEDESIYRSFLEMKGEGVQHLGFVVDDIDREEAKLKRLGIKVLHSGRRADGSGFSYLDTEKMGGVTLSLRPNALEKKH